MKGVNCPFTPGNEGAGVVLHASDISLLGRLVTFCNPNGGCWRQHVVANIDNTIFHEKSLDPTNEQYLSAAAHDPQITRLACGFINPLTSLGLIEEAKQNGNLGIVSLAATSDLGKMIYRCATVQGLQIINVVRSAQRVLDLQAELGNQAIVLDSTDVEFAVKLNEKAEELQAHAALDPVGGSMTGIVFNSLPEKSQVINYGSLSGQDISGVNMVQLRFGEKLIRGFLVFKWYSKLTKEKKDEYRAYVTQNFEQLFTSKIANIFEFEQVETAIQTYHANTSGGKIFLRP